MLAPGRLGFELGQGFGSSLQRSMDRVMRQVAEERTVPIGFDEIAGFPRQREHALGIRGWPSFVALGAFLQFSFAKGIKRHVKALLGR